MSRLRRGMVLLLRKTIRGLVTPGVTKVPLVQMVMA